MFIVHRENMALYQKELILKQQVGQVKAKDFFITGKEFEANEISKINIKKSQYSENVMKYPSCDTSRMKPEEKQKIGQLKEKYDYLLKVLNQLKEVKAQTVEHYYTRMTEINELGTFFKECIEAGKKQLFKEQELIKAAQKGQGGTLLYELKKRKEEVGELVKSAKIDYMQDRHMKTVIYEVIKRIISTAKQQKKFEHISSIKLEWEAFRDMRSLDVLALLLLRKDVLDQLCENLFSHALNDPNAKLQSPIKKPENKQPA